MQELKLLAGEIRSELSSIMSRTQNDFKASLAAVELTVAIHHVFHAPVDKILWDVGEQVRFAADSIIYRGLCSHQRDEDSVLSVVCLFLCVVHPYRSVASMIIFFSKYFLEWGWTGDLLMLLDGQSLNQRIFQNNWPFVYGNG